MRGLIKIRGYKFKLRDTCVNLQTSSPHKKHRVVIGAKLQGTTSTIPDCKIESEPLQVAVWHRVDAKGDARTAQLLQLPPLISISYVDFFISLQKLFAAQSSRRAPCMNKI